MTISFFFVIFLAMPLQEGNTSYQNVNLFVDIDWSQTEAVDFTYMDENRGGRVRVTGEDWQVMSLRQGDSWHTGNAWIFTASTKSNQGDADSFTALKGNYQFLRPASDEDNLIVLKLKFQRQYDGQRGKDGIDWTMKTKFDPFGADVEIPLNDGNVVPSDKLQLSFTRAFFIDAKGNEVTRQNEPYGLKEHIFGAGEKRVRSFKFASIGETVKVRPNQDALARLGFKSDPPPGFQVRELERHVAGYTPSTDSSANKSVEREKQKQQLEARTLELFNTKKYKECIVELDRLLQIDATNAWGFRVRARAYENLGQYRTAVTDYEKSLSIKPDDDSANNSLAWLLATSTDSRVRDGKKAIQYATRACQLSEYKDGIILDTLAAAYAESGDFKKAVLWQTAAVEAISQDQKEDYSSRLRLYESEKPYRER